MDAIILPEAILARFRAVGFERLERIEAGWLALTHGEGTTQLEEEMYRDLHTLKGDARVVGFTDLAVLCQRLEDLLAAARGHKYRVREDVDIVVNMGLQFVGMLLRRKAGVPKGGIALDSFLRQIEEVLAEWLRRSSVAPSQAVAGPINLRLADSKDQFAATTRDRLSAVATSVYLEHLRAGDVASRARLRDIWRVLAGEISGLDMVPLAPSLERHAGATMQLAMELGKAVTVVGNAEGAVVTVEVLDAINTAVLHTLRNAVDHGVESPDMRGALGKPTIATISVRASAADGQVEIVVQDDGAGIDLVRVRQRAIAAKLLNPEEVSAGDERLLEVLFHPGFSTRERVSEVSGRGIGLDAVRSAISGVGGRIEIHSQPGQGTSVTMRVPQARRAIEVHTFRGVGTDVIFAVPSAWTVSVTEGISASIDLAERLALPLVGDMSRVRVLELRRDRMALWLTAGSEPQRASAVRLCPTPAGEEVEIVDLGETEAILVRPEAIVGEGGSSSEGP